MDIDEQIEKENPRNPENKDKSHDLNQSNPQEPIVNEDTTMTDDQHTQDSNGVNLTGSTNTNITQGNNINTKKHHTNIFKATDKQPNNLFIAFFMRDQFERTKNNQEILNDIKNAFLTNNDVIEFKYRRKATLKYFTITVKNRDSFTKIINEPVLLLNGIKPLTFSINIIDQLIANKINNISESTIRLVNVPINYDINLLIKHIANFTGGAITSHKEIKLRPRRNAYNKTKNYSRPLANIYKTVIITFNKKSAADYLLNQNKWEILIETFLIRILPLDEDSNIYKQCTTPVYTVTGIPLNANILDMEPLLDHLKGKAMEFLPTKSTVLHKIAHIYADKNSTNIQELYEKFDTMFKSFKLFTYPAHNFDYMKTCGFCGDDDHNILDCKETDYKIRPSDQQKVYNKKLIKRNNEYTLSDQNKSSYSKIRQLTNTHDNNKLNKAPQKQDNHNENRYQRNKHQPQNEGIYKWDNKATNNKPQNIRSTQSAQKITVGNNNINNNNNVQNNGGISNNTTTNTTNDNTEISKLKERISYLETVIKDISSELQVNNMKQKQHTEEINLLKTQERQHTMKLESISQNCNQIQNTINNQAVAINEIPKMLAILENIQANSFHNMDESRSKAYGSNNYTHPNHQLYEDDQSYNYSQNEYDDPNNRYESSEMVNNVIYPDENYTPSRVRSGFPSISSTVGGLLGFNNKESY
ncbi:hypothetical protein C1646_793907 [Rhizophagus diaphanus]|nr:hypothetical protein C1646_793907 [Rhizophagus diaphanus] [Rhizophagus sp. MUCL 43196]